VTDDPILSDELREDIISRFERRLGAQGDPTPGSVAAHELMLDEARSILDDVIDSYRTATEDVDPGAGRRAAVGARRVAVGVHPAEPLGEASALFEAALPVMLRAFSAVGRSDAEASAALMLHRVIVRRIASSAASDTGLMLKSIRASHRAELARLARDLHDRTAHTIGVAIQNLELHEVHAGRDEAQAQEKLDRAREAMGQALDSVRHFFGELRRTARPGELGQALTEYLTANTDSGVLTSFKVTGDTSMLPRDVCEEVYLTLREAIRNALVHSGTTRLDVSLGVSETRLHARVSDIGRGFSVEYATDTGEGIGLSSMRERVQLLGGTLRLSSVLGRGTTVDLSIPLDMLPP
jgi:signal transduction histidine kinase